MFFPPEDPEAQEVRDLLHQSPTRYGHARTRWTLAFLSVTCPRLAGLSLSGIWRRLAAWHMGRKRSRDRLHSPDPAYREKEAVIHTALAQTQQSPTTHTLLYGDEFTYYRQPEAGLAYWERGTGGHHQPLAHRSRQSHTKRRIVGALDVHTGQVHWRSGSKIGLAALKKHLRELREAYGPDRRLTLVWDNWPVHAHPDVLAVAAEARITLLWLPTYAPWLNPIEKLWHWLKADVLRIHPWSDQWPELQTEVTHFLAQFAESSPALLRYVGLAPEETGEPHNGSP